MIPNSIGKSHGNPLALPRGTLIFHAVPRAAFVAPVPAGS